MKFNDDYSTVDHESVEDDDTCPDCGANGPENCTPECECLICAGKCRECRTALFDDERTRGTCRRCYGDAQALASERGAA